MRKIALFLAGLGFWLAGSSSLMAGAWPREDGAVFVATGGNVILFGDAARPVYYDPTFYLEYGLTPRITLGIDGYTADKGTSGSILGFAQLSFGSLDRPSRTAVSIAAGATRIPTGRNDQTLRLAFHWGRGMEWGWVSGDYAMTFGSVLDRFQEKLTLTAGYGFDEKWTGILTAEAGLGLELDLYAKLSPSIVYHLSDRVSLRASYTQALTGDRGGAAGVQAWIRF
jgi:hypothetical protein